MKTLVESILGNRKTVIDQQMTSDEGLKFLKDFLYNFKNGKPFSTEEKEKLFGYLNKWALEGKATKIDDPRYIRSERTYVFIRNIKYKPNDLSNPFKFNIYKYTEPYTCDGAISMQNSRELYIYREKNCDKHFREMAAHKRIYMTYEVQPELVEDVWKYMNDHASRDI